MLFYLYFGHLYLESYLPQSVFKIGQNINKQYIHLEPKATRVVFKYIPSGFLRPLIGIFIYD